MKYNSSYRIYLNGHDKSVKYLKPISLNTYKLYGNNLDYCRLTFEQGDHLKYTMIDPPGGPMMQIGDCNIIPGYCLKSIDIIKDDYVLRFIENK